MTKKIVYLNGEFLLQENAKISILDRGWLFGDGIYEVIPIYDGSPFALNEHIERLEHGSNYIHMKRIMNIKTWKHIVHQLIMRNPHMEGCYTIYLQITRGPQKTRHHAIPKDYNPTVLALPLPVCPPKHSDLELGFAAITLEDSRRRDCFVKSTNLLANVLLYEQALREGASESILIRDGCALEGTSSNLFIVIKGHLITPPLTPNILGGVTRKILLALAERHSIPNKECPISELMLHQADEIWLSGSSKEILPITTLDKKPVGSGSPGALWRCMISHYHALVKEGQL